jgi:predicted hydrocarbon binding protein
MSDKRCTPYKSKRDLDVKKEKPKESSLEAFSFLKEIAKFDAETSEVQAADVDWLIVRGDLMRTLFEGLRIFLGEDANPAIKAAGKNTARRFIDSLSERGMSAEEANTILNMLVDQGGWGKPETKIDMEAKKAKLIIENCVTARKLKSTEPSCTFMEGWFEGVCEKLFKMDVKCVETACKAKGDETCIFEARTR